MNAPHWIAGAWVGMPSVDSIDPATGEAIGQFADGGVPEADAAIAAARHVFDRTTWAQDARLRQDVLLAWATALDVQRESLATLLTRENGKAIAQSRGEIAGAISEVRYYAGLARHIAGHVLEPEPGIFSTMLREAAGVAGDHRAVECAGGAARALACTRARGGLHRDRQAGRADHAAHGGHAALLRGDLIAEGRGEPRQ
jgi:hypothetical protein